MNSNDITNMDTASRMLHLMPVLSNRFELVRNLGIKSDKGEFIRDADLWLARSDLASVISVMLAGDDNAD